MQHKCRVEVIDKKLFPDYQKAYLADPDSGVCPFYKIGDVTIFERYGGEDTFWTAARGAHCAEAWDCISRYIYTALQGGSIMRGWTNDERMMIACCNDGTRPVIFKIERLDYKVVRLEQPETGADSSRLKKALEDVPGVEYAQIRTDKSWAEVFVGKDADPEDAALIAAANASGYQVAGID